ncbi:MAG: AI-2E family transporter [Kofleriaceae bacterium]|nr:AI-2E family transporter [Kofleriaceae bacterium]
MADDKDNDDTPSTPGEGATPGEGEEGKGEAGSRRWRDRNPGVMAFWQRSAKLWGFLGFRIFILILARHVVLPFILATLLAYILTPLVRRMSTRSDGSKRMPNGAAILLCYFVLIGAIAAFMFLLLPRLSKDVARIGKEAPGLVEKINDEWAPDAAHWLEKRFPSLKTPMPVEADNGVVADMPLPPGTQFVVTPLPDGRLAVQLEESGLLVSPTPEGGYTITPSPMSSEPLQLEDKIRNWAKGMVGGLKGQLGEVVKLGQRFVAALLNGIFKFFLVLMIAAFIMLDLPKIHGFVRGLFPSKHRDDYDVIVEGIDRGLSGVIRGQLIICLVNGVFTYIGLLIFSVNYSLILAIVAAILSLIPIFGSILSTIPVVLVALVSGDEGLDFSRPVFMVAWIVGIHFIEANLLNPKIIGTAAKMHPVLVIFALVLGEHSFGLTGALLAVPTASIIQVFFLFFKGKAWRGHTESVPIVKA